MQHFYFPYDDLKIPDNGIYILFERGETGHGTDRIVRIGTHTGENQLRPRLTQHFLHKNKDRSIFRKNIGRAFLNLDKDPFLSQWNLDLTTRKAKDKYSSTIDFAKQAEVEHRVSKHIQENLFFVVFEVNEKAQRLALEEKIIGTVSHCADCGPSEQWLGLHSPLQKIRDCGLWLVNGLNGDSLSYPDLEYLSSFVVT